MTREEWDEHLTDATGPLAFDRIDTLQPEPELLELLRDLVQPPWPEEPERNIDFATPLLSAILLGLVGDEESIPVQIKGLQYAHEVEWDWYTDDGPKIFGLIGPTALPLLVEEIQRVERDSGPSYYYGALVEALAAIGRLHPEVIPSIAELAAVRIKDRTYDREYASEVLPEPTTFQEQMAKLAEEPTRTELWVDMNLDLAIPELRPVIDEFFERHGPGYDSAIFGNRDDYWEWVEKHKSEPLMLRKTLIQSYRKLHTRTTNPESETLSAQELAEERQFEQELMRRERGWYDDDPYVPHQPYVRAEPKVGRNDPCPCGSGKKYKKCHGK
jgi:uncharacterized protein YecA (UPF0149 family)